MRRSLLAFLALFLVFSFSGCDNGKPFPLPVNQQILVIRRTLFAHEDLLMSGLSAEKVKMSQNADSFTLVCPCFLLDRHGELELGAVALIYADSLTVKLLPDADYEVRYGKLTINRHQ